MSYMKRSPGNKCRVCGADISYRPPNVHICLDCKKKEDKAKANAKRAYLKELERRDTKARVIIEKRQDSKETGKEYVYRICPSCNAVLNSSDRFCRFCGQRVKGDAE